MMRLPAIEYPDWKGITVPASAWGMSVLRKVASLSYALADSRPRVYLLLTAVWALAGGLWLLLFPWLLIHGVLAMHVAVTGGQSVDWMALALWLLTAMVSALVCYRVYGLSTDPPAGTVLDATTHPELLSLITDLAGHYRGTRVDRVVLSGSFELEIVRTLRTGLPFCSVNTLVIGRPLMQCLSVRQFQCALARRLGQYSARYNRVVHTLGSLRGIWSQYCVERDGLLTWLQPVAWFFRYYVPFYRAIANPAACLDELAADRYAMELFSDEDVQDLITTEMVCRHYLDAKYWPVVRKYAMQNSRVVDSLHSGMASVLRAGLQADSLGEWVSRTLSDDEDCDGDTPSLARRIDNIGFDSARMGVLTAAPAANVYRI